MEFVVINHEDFLVLLVAVQLRNSLTGGTKWGSLKECLGAGVNYERIGIQCI